MQAVDDNTLLRQYAETLSDEAFTELVARHINLVYSVAMRQVGDPNQAQEIAQVVFIILARKAASLRHEKALSSWLFQTTRLTANNSIRSEMRRQRREQEAFMQSPPNESPESVWHQIAPELDAAVAALGAQDRRAILLRFYEGRNLREVGDGLGASEGAAEKRVARALEKLRKFFSKRGVDSTSRALAGAISGNSIQAAPVGLAKTVSTVAVAKGAAASTSTLTLLKGALKVMAWSKTKTAIVGVAVALLAIGTTTIVADALLPLPDIQGAWEANVAEGAGVHMWESAKETYVMRITETNGRYQASCDLIEVGLRDVKFDAFTYKYPYAHAGITLGNESFSCVAEVSRFGKKMDWTVSESTNVSTVVFRRTSHPTPFPEPITDAEFGPQAGSALQGFWVGQLGRGNSAIHINVKVAEAPDGKYRADFYNVDETGTNRQPTAVSFDGTTVKLMPLDGSGMYEGWLRNGGKEMVGNWIESDVRTEMTFTKADHSGYDARMASPAVLTDRGFKDLYGPELGENVTLKPGASWQTNFSFPYHAGDAGTWASWFFLEGIRTTAASPAAGTARADVYFDGIHHVPVYFSNQGGNSGPLINLSPWADPTVPHTVRLINSGNSSLTVGGIWIRWPVDCTTNVANARAAAGQIASDIRIPPYGGHYTFTVQFPSQSRDQSTWACWLMFPGIETESASREAGESRVQLWLDGNNYTSFALNNQGQAETQQQAITWSQFIGNTNTIDPRRPHTVMLVNLDSQPLVIPSLWVRWFVPH